MEAVVRAEGLAWAAIGALIAASIGLKALDLVRRRDMTFEQARWAFFAMYGLGVLTAGGVAALVTALIMHVTGTKFG